MRLIMEYMGLALISVVVGGALLYGFITASDSGLMQVGTLAAQELSDLNTPGMQQSYSQEEMDQRIFFSYEEKLYTAGVFENVAGQFRAENIRGKQLPVRLERVVSFRGEVCTSDEKGVTFPEGGVYAVYVTAGGSSYMVTVPVAESAQNGIRDPEM